MKRMGTSEIRIPFPKFRNKGCTRSVRDFRDEGDSQIKTAEVENTKSFSSVG